MTRPWGDDRDWTTIERMAVNHQLRQYQTIGRYAFIALLGAGLLSAVLITVALSPQG